MVKLQELTMPPLSVLLVMCMMSAVIFVALRYAR